MIQSINHVTYSVSNIKSSIEFYKNILKTKILLRNEKIHISLLVGYV